MVKYQTSKVDILFETLRCVRFERNSSTKDILIKFDLDLDLRLVDSFSDGGIVKLWISLRSPK